MATLEASISSHSDAPKKSESVATAAREVGVAIREDMVYDEFGGEPAKYDWSKSSKSCLCSCFKKYFVQLVLASCTGSFLFGLNISLLNTCLNYISWQWHWCDWPNEAPTDCSANTNYNALTSTAMFIGAAVGSMSAGGLLVYGRRLFILVSMGIMAVGVVSQCVANSFSALFWARLIVGFGIGIVSFSVPTYMSEVTPAEERGKFGVFHQLFVTVGIFIGVLIGLPMPLVQLVPGAGDDSGPEMFIEVWWRVMLGLGLLPIILSVYLFGFVFDFETPNYYIEHRQYADAEELLRRLTGQDDVKERLREIREEIDAAEQAKKDGMSLGMAWKNKEFRWVIVYGCMLSAFQQFSGINVFMTASNSLFMQAGLTGVGPTYASIGMDALNMVMTLPAVPLIEKLGRRTLMVIGTAGQTISVAPAAIMYWVNDDPDYKPTTYIAIVGCLCFIIFFACTYGPILWVYLFEIYPSEIKGAAAGLATGFNWIASIIMVFIPPYCENKYSYTIFTIMSGCAFVIVLLWMKETKGRPLGDSPFITKSV